jgi:hypothetical protein
VVITVLYLRSPGYREILANEAGELTVPGQESLLARMNKSFPEFVHAPDVIIVSMSRDRDYALGGVYQPAERPG